MELNVIKSDGLLLVDPGRATFPSRDFPVLLSTAVIGSIKDDGQGNLVLHFNDPGMKNELYTLHVDADQMGTVQKAYIVLE